MSHAHAQPRSTIELDQHKLLQPEWIEGREGLLLAASAVSLDSALGSQGIEIVPGFPCDEHASSCAPLVLRASKTGQNRQSSVAQDVRIVPLASLGAGRQGPEAWWVESTLVDAGLTCERPSAELWPLFVDGTAYVGRSWIIDADRPKRPGPQAVWLRHAAGELHPSGLARPRFDVAKGPLCQDFGPMPAVEALQPNFQDTAIWHAAIRKKRVALTFDACSTFAVGRFNPAVIAALEAFGVPATLFVGGHWAEMFPQELERLAAHPLFEIGNHTYSHPHMRDLPPQRQRQELLWTQQLIYSRTGLLPRFFRPPYGEVDDVMLAETAKAGLTTVEYDLPAGDADVHVSAPKLIEWVTTHVTAGSVVIMHMNRPGNHTAEAIGAVARQLRGDGYQFCRLTDLIADEEGGCL